jgi:hypothetical protein
MFAITQLVGKHRGLIVPTFIAVVDYTEACDRFNQSKVWEIMEERRFLR